MLQSFFCYLFSSHPSKKQTNFFQAMTKGSDRAKAKIHPALRGLRKSEEKRNSKVSRASPPLDHRLSYTSHEEEPKREAAVPHGTCVHFFPPPPSALLPSVSSFHHISKGENTWDRGSSGDEVHEWYPEEEEEGGHQVPSRNLPHHMRTKTSDREDMEADCEEDRKGGTWGAHGSPLSLLRMAPYEREGEGEEETEGDGPDGSHLRSPTSPRAPTAPHRRNSPQLLSWGRAGCSSSQRSSVPLSPSWSDGSGSEQLSPITPDSFGVGNFSFSARNMSTSGCTGSPIAVVSPLSSSDMHTYSKVSTGKLTSLSSRREGGRMGTCSSLSPPGTGSRIEGKRGNGGEAICVVVRCRPALTPAEKKEEGVVFFHCQKAQVSTSHHSDKARDLCWRMDKAIWSGEGPSADGVLPASQEDVYAEVGRPLLLHALEGYNSTLLAYGPTGSGKTYTMMGGGSRPGDVSASANPTQLGIIPRLSYELFEEIARRMGSYESPRRMWRRSSRKASTELVVDGSMSGNGSFSTVGEESGGEEEPVAGGSHGGALYRSRTREGAFREVLVFSHTSPRHGRGESSSHASGTEESPPERTTCVERSEWEVHVRYVEVYCERITDLLNNGAPVTLREEVIGPDGSSVSGNHGHRASTAYVATTANVNQNGTTAFCLTGAKRIKAVCGDDLLRALNTGNKWRHTGATKANDQSSRSHAIFIIELTEVLHFTDLDGNPSCARNKSLAIRLVDLAGSERISKTGAEGKVFKEAKDINLSLFTLGRVIESLTEGKGSKNRLGGGGGKKHTPYRSSTLTKILRDAFGGDSKTTLIATVVPFASARQETIQTLNYAATARCVVNRPRLAEVPGTLKLRKAMNELYSLRKELENAQSSGFSQPQSHEWISSMEANEESRLQHEATVKALQKQLEEANERLRREESLARQQYEEMQEREANLERLLSEKEHETQQIHSTYEGHMRALERKIVMNKREQQKHNEELKRARLEAEAQVRGIQEEFECTEEKLRQKEAEARRAQEELSAKLKKTSSEARRKLELMKQKQELLEEEMELKEEEAKWMETEAKKKYAKAKEALQRLEMERLEKEAENAAALQAIEEERKKHEKELEEQVSRATANLKHVEHAAREQTALLEANWATAEGEAARLELEMKKQQEEMEQRLREAQDQIEQREEVLKSQLRETEEELRRRHKAAKNAISKLAVQKREIKEMYVQKISEIEKKLQEEKDSLEQRAKDAEAHLRAVEESSQRERMALNEKYLLAEKRSKEVENEWNLKQESLRHELTNLEHGYKKKEADLEAALQEEMQKAKKETQERQHKMEAEFFQSMEEFRSREEKVQREHRELVAEMEKAKCDAQRRAQLAELEKELLEKEIQMKGDQLELMEAEAARRKKMLEEVIPQLEAEMSHREAQFEKRINGLKAELEKRDEELRRQGVEHQKHLSNGEEENQREMDAMQKKWMASEEMVGQLKGLLEHTRGEQCQEVLRARLEFRKSERELTAALEEKKAALLEKEQKRVASVEEVKEAAEAREKDLKHRLEELSAALELAHAHAQQLSEKYREAMEEKMQAEVEVAMWKAQAESHATEVKGYVEKISVLKQEEEGNAVLMKVYKEHLLQSEEEVHRLSAQLELESLAHKAVLEEKEQELKILRKPKEMELSGERSTIESLKEQLRATEAHVCEEKIAGLRRQDAILNDVDMEFQSTALVMTAAAAEVRQLKEALEVAMKKNKELESDKASLQRDLEKAAVAFTKEREAFSELMKEKETFYARNDTELEAKWSVMNAAVTVATEEVEKMKEQYDLLQSAHQDLRVRWEAADKRHGEAMQMVVQLGKEKEQWMAQSIAEKKRWEKKQQELQQECEEKIRKLVEELTKQHERESRQEAKWDAERLAKETEVKEIKKKLQEETSRQDAYILELRQQERRALERGQVLEGDFRKTKGYMESTLKLVQEYHLKVLEAQLQEIEHIVVNREREWGRRNEKDVWSATQTCSRVAKEEAASMNLAFRKELEQWKKDVEAAKEAGRQEAERSLKEAQAQVKTEVVKQMEKVRTEAREKRLAVVEGAEQQYQAILARLTAAEAIAKDRQTALQKEVQEQDKAKRQLVALLQDRERELETLHAGYKQLEGTEKAVQEELAHQKMEWNKKLLQVSAEKEQLGVGYEKLLKMVKEIQLENEKRVAQYRQATTALDEAKQRHQMELEEYQRRAHAASHDACRCVFQLLLEIEKRERAEIKSRYFHEVFLLENVEELEANIIEHMESQRPSTTSPKDGPHGKEEKDSFLPLLQSHERWETAKREVEIKEQALKAREDALLHQAEEVVVARRMCEREGQSLPERAKALECEEEKQEEREAAFQEKEAGMLRRLEKLTTSLFLEYASKSYQLLREKEEMAFRVLLTRDHLEKEKLFHISDWKLNCQQVIEKVRAREKHLGEEARKLAEKLRVVKEAEAAQRASNERDEAALKKVEAELKERRKHAELIARKNEEQLAMVAAEKETVERRKEQLEQRVKELQTEQIASEREIQEANAELDRREEAMGKELQEKMAQVEATRESLTALEAKSRLQLQALEEEWNQMKSRQRALEAIIYKKENALAEACAHLEQVQEREQALEHLLRECHLLLDGEHAAKIKGRKAATYLTTELLEEQEKVQETMEVWKRSFAILRTAGELVCPQCGWKDKRDCLSCRCCGLSFEVDSPSSSGEETAVSSLSVNEEEETPRGFSAKGMDQEETVERKAREETGSARVETDGSLLRSSIPVSTPIPAGEDVATRTASISTSVKEPSLSPPPKDPSASTSLKESSLSTPPKGTSAPPPPKETSPSSSLKEVSACSPCPPAPLGVACGAPLYPRPTHLILSPPSPRSMQRSHRTPDGHPPTTPISYSLVRGSAAMSAAETRSNGEATGSGRSLPRTARMLSSREIRSASGPMAAPFPPSVATFSASIRNKLVSFFGSEEHRWMSNRLAHEEMEERDGSGNRLDSASTHRTVGGLTQSGNSYVGIEEQRGGGGALCTSIWHQPGAEYYSTSKSRSRSQSFTPNATGKESEEGGPSLVRSPPTQDSNASPLSFAPPVTAPSSGFVHLQGHGPWNPPTTALTSNAFPRAYLLGGVSSCTPVAFPFHPDFSGTAKVEGQIEAERFLFVPPSVSFPQTHFSGLEQVGFQT